MRSISSFINKNVFFILLVLLGCYWYSALFINRSCVEVVIEGNKRFNFELYWAAGNNGYSAYNKGVAYIRDNKKYEFYLTDLRKIDRIRIDTHNFIGKVTVKSLKISQPGYGEITFTTEKDWQRLSPLLHVEKTIWSEKGMTIVSNGSDPMLELQVPPAHGHFPLAGYLIRFAVITALIWLGVNSLGSLNQGLRYIPLLLFGALILSLVVAVTTVDRYHPDEAAHASAAAYYKEHWQPPMVEDESIRHTYSCYGSSRLNNGEIYYLLAGKFAKLLELHNLSGFLPYRLFNVFLLGLIFLYTVRVPQSRLLAVPLVVSPQIWYAFSYCTSDALALFAAFIVGCQLLVENSFFNQLLRGKFSFRHLACGILSGICLALLFLIKINYYPYIAAVFTVAACSYLIWRNDDYAEQKKYSRLVVVFAVALCLLGVHKWVDVSVNGFDKKERVAKLQNEIAKPMFNMSSPLSKRSPVFNIKERGQSLHHLLFVHRWFERTFRSSFGVYGHTNVMGPEGYYDGVRWTGIAFFLFLIGSVLLKAPWINKGETIILLGLSIALIAASVHHSWTMEIQAQGRYLFPVFGMFGLIIARNYRYINARILALFVSMMFILAAWSFICEAIVRIPR